MSPSLELGIEGENRPGDLYHPENKDWFEESEKKIKNCERVIRAIEELEAGLGESRPKETLVMALDVTVAESGLAGGKIEINKGSERSEEKIKECERVPRAIDEAELGRAGGWENVHRAQERPGSGGNGGGSGDNQAANDGEGELEIERDRPGGDCGHQRSIG